MPKYYFDFEKVATAWQDDEGLECSDANAACELMR